MPTLEQINEAAPDTPVFAPQLPMNCLHANFKITPRKRVRDWSPQTCGGIEIAVAMPT
jgi:hypothetical protein